MSHLNERQGRVVGDVLMSVPSEVGHEVLRPGLMPHDGRRSGAAADAASARVGDVARGLLSFQDRHDIVVAEGSAAVVSCRSLGQGCGVYRGLGTRCRGYWVVVVDDGDSGVAAADL